MGTFKSAEWIKKYYTVQGEANVYSPISFYASADTIYVTNPTLNADKNAFEGGKTLSAWRSEVNTALGGAGGSSLKDTIRNDVAAKYVPLTRKIAGVDLADDVTKAELLKALNVSDGANNYVHPTYTPTSAGYSAASHSVTVRDLTITNGHISAVGADETLSHIVTGPGALTTDTVVLGNGTDAVKASSYTISNGTLADSATAIPTSHAVSQAISVAKAAGVEYKGTFTAWPATLPSGLSKGDFYKFTAPASGSSETLPAGIHAGDIAIYNASGAKDVPGNFDIIHSERDKDTDTYYKLAISGHTITLTAQGSKAGDATQSITVPDNDHNTAALSYDAATHAVKAGVDGTSAVIPLGTASAVGLVKAGTTNGKTYGVAIDGNGAMTVNVPWTDTNYYVTSAAFTSDATNKVVKRILTRNDKGTVAANIPAASTTAYGVTRLSDATNSTSSDVAATSKAVNSVLSVANSKAAKVTTKEFSGANASTTAAYSAVTVNSEGVVSKVGQFIVSATSTSDTALNNLAVGGFALIG